MANPSLQIGNDNWAVKEDNLLGYSTAGTRFVPEPITMTRSSAGTRVNPSGLVETVELVGSEEVPSIASIVNIGGGTITQISGNSYSSASDGTTGSAVRPKFDFATSAGKRYKLTITPTGTISGTVNFDFYDGSSYLFQNYDFTTTKEIYFIDNGSVFGAFDGTQTYDVSSFTVSVKEATIDNLARVDYTDGTSSLLAEPQRTNIVTYSETYGSGTFFIGTSGSTIDNTTNISPSGDANATQLTSTGAGKLQSGGLGLTQNTDYVLSFYAKNVDATLVNSRVLGLGGSGGTNLTSVDYTSQLSTTEWTRITHTFNTGTNTTIYVYLSSSLNSGGTIQLWGAQLEEGSYPTSYIPTDGSTVTRVQDQYEKTGISDLINDSEGTLYFEGSALENGSGSHRIISLSDGTWNNLIYMRFDSTASRFRGFVRGSGGSYTIITVNSVPQTDNNKIALVWDATNFRIWINGSERATATINDLPVGMNALNLTDVSGTTDPFFGKVRQLQVFKTALSDSELIALTT